MITVFDLIDAAAVAAVIMAWRHSARFDLWPPVLSLMLFHVFGRFVVWHDPTPFPEHAVAELAIASGYVVSGVLTNWCRAIGSIWATLSIVSVIAAVTGADATPGAGIGLNAWNIHSVGLDMIAALTIGGLIRHGLLHGNRARRV